MPSVSNKSSQSISNLQISHPLTPSVLWDLDEVVYSNG